MNALRTIAALALAVLVSGSTAAPPPDAPAQEPIRVVATLPVYASLVEEIAGDAVRVTSIADPTEDAHFVRPKPSFARDVRQADLFITTGLDLELWVPTVLDRANNPQVMEGGEGYVTAYTGIELLDIPETADRGEGDVHIYGNPHLHTDPLRTLQVARNIKRGLDNVAPERSERWDRGLDSFADRIYRALFGDELVEILGGEALEELAKSGNFFGFLRDNDYQGRPLMDRLGGWLAAGEAFRGEQMVCYHKNWAYLEDRFDVECAAYVEVKPGVPPRPRHVSRLIDLMESQNLRVLLGASYFDRNKVQQVAQRGGARPVIVHLYPGAAGLEDYFDVVNHWVDSLAEAFRETRAE